MPLKLIGDRDNVYVYPWYISDITATKDLQKILGVCVKKAFSVIDHEHWTFYYDEATSVKVGQTIYKKITSSRKFFEQTLKKIYELSDEMLEFGKRVKKLPLKKLSDQELLKAYEEYTRRLIALRVWGWIPVFLDGLDKSFLSVRVMADLEKFLKKRRLSDQASRIYSLMSSSDKMSEVQREEIARLALLEKLVRSPEGKSVLAAIKRGQKQVALQKFPRAAQLIRKHLKDYGWLTYAYSGPVMDADYLLGVLKADLDKGDIKNQVAAIKKHFATIKDEQEVMVKQLDLPKGLVQLFKISSELMFIKDYRKGVYQQSYVFMDPVMTELSRRLSISLKEIKFMTLAEVRAALAGKFSNLQAGVKARTEKCCYVASEGEVKVYSGVECERLIDKIIAKKANTEKPPQVREFKGQIAYSGKARGTVRVVLVKADVAKVQEGDILVSSATNPDLIVAMKKAGAFVTDFGGIISHAAIVSRELKKPCIVGTRIGTKVLKDGDQVEVDADKGVVKLINN